MITLIHGDLIDASRKELIRIKSESQAKEIRELDGKTLDETNLTQAVESQSLFGGDTLVVIENLFGKLGKKIKLVESLCIILSTGSADILLWEDKEVGATVLKNLKNANVQLFKTPQLLFTFLDGLKIGGTTSSLHTLKALLETTAAEIVLTMLMRRARQLIALSDNVIPEGLQSWQATRLTAQARGFTMDKLLSMHTKLLAIDIATKTGSTPFTLSQQLEQFVIDL